jgi:hypothetical protein
MKESDFIQAQVDLALLRSDGFAEAEDEIAPPDTDETEASPWLKLTRWAEYTQGHGFTEVASLAFLPDPATEPILIAVEQSVQRLVQRAFDSISSHRINEFDQVRINSFVHKPGVLAATDSDQTTTIDLLPLPTGLGSTPELCVSHQPARPADRTPPSVLYAPVDCH